ncbi:MAG: mechanosensitive ion channel [Candidatus Altiarchaeales archaeon]|nr:mechanosensitive ion channel [Candidatus Altiarchaeales archaeon]
MRPFLFIKGEQEFTQHLRNIARKQSVFIIINTLLFIVSSFLYISVQKQVLPLPVEYATVILNVGQILLMFLITSILLKATTPLLTQYTQFLDATSRRMLVNVWNYMLWGIALLIVVARYTGNISSLGIGLGVFSAGLAVALQQPITSLVGWMIINSKQPFRIGDRIIVRNMQGDVVDITTFYTVLREFGRDTAGDDPTGVLITLPNNIVLQEAVFNYTKEFPFIWDDVTVSITYESNFAHAKKLVKQAAEEVLGDSMEKAVNRMRFYLKDTPQENVLSEEPIVFSTFAPSSVDFSVKYVCEAIKRRRTKSEITYRILELINEPENKGKVHIAYPHTEVVFHK